MVKSTLICLVLVGISPLISVSRSQETSSPSTESAKAVSAAEKESLTKQLLGRWVSKEKITWSTPKPRPLIVAFVKDSEGFFPGFTYYCTPLIDETEAAAIDVGQFTVTTARRALAKFTKEEKPSELLFDLSSPGELTTKWDGKELHFVRESTLETKSKPSAATPPSLTAASTAAPKPREEFIERTVPTLESLQGVRVDFNSDGTIRREDRNVGAAPARETSTPRRDSSDPGLERAKVTSASQPRQEPPPALAAAAPQTGTPALYFVAGVGATLVFVFLILMARR